MRGSWWRAWWWVICFSITVTCLYFHFVQKKREEILELSTRYDEMKKEKELVFQERESLRLQIESQSDPSWIEMILMRDLGVVPEGWLKVHFTK